MIDSTFPEVVVACPQERDLREVHESKLGDSFRVHFVGADLDALSKSDLRGTLAALQAAPADGMLGTKDRSALLAAVVAQRRGLPGPQPAAMLACQHKLTSRLAQARVVPEAAPRFILVRSGTLAGGGDLPFPPPYFVKPVVGRLSVGARRVDDPAELALLENDDYADRFAEIATLAGMPASETRGFLVEELLHGRELTFEGYRFRGTIVPIGFTDSVKYPGTNSFERFEYPSSVGEEREAEIVLLADKVLAALDFDDGIFNMELFVPDEGAVRIIEVNGRIASQFAPLVRALHSRSTYEAAFRLACGHDPLWKFARPDGVAVSYCLRTFEDAYVAAVPDPDDNLEILVRPGLLLSEQGTNDTASFRLAIVHDAGETGREAVERCRARVERLRFSLQAPGLRSR